MIYPHLLEAWAELTAGETMATWRAADLRSGAEQRDDMAGATEGVRSRGRIGDTFAARMVLLTVWRLQCEKCQG